jgi:hypothetical protein
MLEMLMAEMPDGAFGVLRAKARSKRVWFRLFGYLVQVFDRNLLKESKLSGPTSAMLALTPSSSPDPSPITHVTPSHTTPSHFHRPTHHPTLLRLNGIL